MRDHIHSVVFDFDYTLADSSPGIVASVNYALRQLGLPEADPRDICATIGLSLPLVWERLVGLQSRSLSERFISLFVSHADEVMVDQVIVYPAVPPTLRSLRNQGISLGIVSTKFRCRIEAVLKRENLSHWFNTIVGGEDVRSHKPDPEGLLAAVSHLKTAVKHCLYVGDSVTDAETARRAGIRFVGVLSGVTLREQFQEYSTSRILESLLELPGFISHLNNGHHPGEPS